MRKTHPNLFKAYLIYAVISIALGLNFLFLTPTFMPLSVPKWPIGLILIGCGILKLALLRRPPSKGLRSSMALTVAIYSFWAGALVFDFFRLSMTSLQLPLTYIGLAAVGLVLSFEPFINPATSRAGK